MKKLYRLADEIFEIDHLFDTAIEEMKEYEISEGIPKYKISYSLEDLYQYKKDHGEDFDSFSIEQINGSYIYGRVGTLFSLENKFIIHGSSVYLDSVDNAYLFTALSGTGKSTHTRLLKETYGDRIEYINDDKPFIYNENGKFTIYGGPWNGKEKLSNNVKCILKGIFIIERGNKNTATKITPDLAMKYLIKQFYLPRGTMESKNMLNCLIELSNNVPVYILNIDMSDDAPKASYEIMLSKTLK